MLNDQKPPSNPDNQPANVVVNMPAAAPPTRLEEAVPQATRVSVYPGNAGNNSPPGPNPGAQQLHARQEVVLQRRFGVGKTIDLVWYVLGVLEIVLAARFFFELTAANSAAGFVRFILGISEPFSWPFNGIFSVVRDGRNIFDTNILIGMVVYAIIAWGITRLLAMTIEPPSVT
jgi:hypothetical protein